eukprot:gene17496-19247_t
MIAVIKERDVFARITRTVNRGTKWVLDEQEADGKWLNLHQTGNTIATLKLLGHDLEESKSCKKTFATAAKFFEKSKGEVLRTHGGQLAYVIMGLKALCQDPRWFHGADLTTRLLEDLRNYPKGKFNHPFQYSLAIVALAVNNVSVPSEYPMKLVEKIELILRTNQQHSKDTCAMMDIALASVYKQFEKQPMIANKIKRIMLKLTRALAMKVSHERDNLFTKSLVMQAQTAVNSVLLDTEHVEWKSSKCNDVYNSIMNKKVNGSFGSLSANLHALPALAGVSYLDLMTNNACPVIKKVKNEAEKIYVCVRIEFEAVNRQNPPRQTVVMVNGSTALDALRYASLMPNGCSLMTKNTAWGVSVQGICNVSINHAKKFYWMFYIDDKPATTAVSNYHPKTGECIVMKYQALDF